MSQLSNIEQSSDNICVFKSIEDCNTRQSRPFSKFIINKWKADDAVFQSIISTNSRPIPQPRKGRVKTRALPEIDPLNSNCWEDSSLCNLYSINGGLIDPNTGYYVDNNNHNTINPDDYLNYSNPDVRINAEGKIACDSESGILRHNNYSGPGWKTSRVHPEKKTGLSRPIKHWRRQLLPRQFINSQTGVQYESFDNIDFDSNIPRRGRSNIQIDLFNRPGGYSITTKDYLTGITDYNNQVSCIPIYVNKGKDKLLYNCNELNKINNIDTLLCVQAQALLKSRPIINRKFNPWSFSSEKGYLQARVKLYDQNNTFSFNKYIKHSDINKNKFILSTISLHLNHKLIYYQDSDLNNNSLNYTKTCFTDCSCIAPVTFKPSNPNFKTNGAVTSRNNIRRKTKIATNRNQYNITNSWGVNGKHDSLYTKCNNYRVTQKGSYNCNFDINKELIPSSDWSYMFAYGVIYSGDTNSRPANYNFFLNSPLKNFINTPVTQGILDYMQYYTKYATSMEAIFINAFNFNQDISKWNVNNVTNMSSMFGDASNFNQDIGNWNVYKVRNMSFMFSKANNFNQDIGNWIVNNVTDMKAMFQECSFNQNIGNWIVNNVTNMSYMFKRAIDFNGNIGSWNVHNVTSMIGMFQESSFNQDISGWNTFNVTNMAGMFNGATNFNQNINWTYNFNPNLPMPLPDESKQWNTNKVKDMRYMFGDASNFNQDLSAIITSNVTNMECMFQGATSFNQYINSFNGPNIFIGVTPWSWDVKNVTSMTYMFNGAISFNQPLGEWQLHNNVDLTNMFLNATKMLDYYDVTPNKTANNRLELYPKNKSILQRVIKDNSYNDYGIINTWNTSRITSMASLFKSTSFNENITDWNVENVTEMGEMFMQATEFNNDLSWNVSNVTDFTFMFTSATNFNGNISEWDTQKVEAMNAMFSYASSFNQDISKWNTSKVTSMKGMFAGAVNFNQDISKWNTSKVTIMEGMFAGAVNFNKPINNFSIFEQFENIFIGKEYKNNYWNVENVENMMSMFSNATTFNQDIKYWNVASVTSMAGMFAGASSFNQNLKDWKQYMRSDVILTDIFTSAQAMINRFGNQIQTISYSNWETVFTES